MGGRASAAADIGANLGGLTSPHGCQFAMPSCQTRVSKAILPVGQQRPQLLLFYRSGLPPGFNVIPVHWPRNSGVLVLPGELPVKRRQADTQADRGLFLVAAAGLQRAVELGLFLLSQKRLQWLNVVRR